jgi:signal transduction histidine kinase
VVETQQPNVLVMVGDPDLSSRIGRRLALQGFRVANATDAATALTRLAAGGHDAVVIGEPLSGIPVVALVRAVNGQDPLMPCILVTPTDGVEAALEALEDMNCECLVRDAGGAYLRLLPSVIGRALQRAQRERDRASAEAELRRASERLEEMVAANAQALEAAQAQLALREKLAVLGEVAGGVVHELRTPLSIIKSAVYLLREAAQEPDLDANRILAIIEAEVERSDRIVGDLLDFARTGIAVPQPFEVEPLVTTALTRARVPDGIEVVVDMPATLPKVLADPVQMEQVLLNLITNAHQSMGETGTLTIRAGVTADGDQVTLTIADTGKGIGSESSARLFEPLFSTRRGGVGLGLALCKHHVRANDGTIEAANRAEGGAIFTVTLPAAELNR